MSRRNALQPVERVAVVLLVLSCGRPELRETRREQVSLDEMTHGSDDLRLVVHSVSCPSERRRITVPAHDAAVTRCLSALVIGSTIEDVDYIYRRPPMSCGGQDLPRATLGGCALGTVPGVQFEALGTPCAP